MGEDQRDKGLFHHLAGGHYRPYGHHGYSNHGHHGYGIPYAYPAPPPPYGYPPVAYPPHGGYHPTGYPPTGYPPHGYPSHGNYPGQSHGNYPGQSHYSIFNLNMYILPLTNVTTFRFC